MSAPMASGDSPRMARLIVEVRGGRSGATKAVLEPGGALRFGRTSLADVTVPHDETLSGVHFEVAWDGERCLVRDRNSHAGTFVDGLPVLRAQVSHGGWIRAGRTDFVVYIEDRATPAHEPPFDPPSEALSFLSELTARAAGEPVYAILDGARDERIVPLLRASVEAHQSLYEGVEGETMDLVAPYLVGPLAPGSALLRRLVLEGAGPGWGIFLASKLPFRELRRHFRRFLMVELEDSGERVYFRYYDPWVLRTIWPATTAQQRAELTSSGEITLLPPPESPRPAEGSP